MTNGTYLISTNGPADTNVFYRIHLLASDTNGNQRTIYQDVQPRLSEIALVTVPSGLQLGFDGQPIIAPTSMVTVAGMNRQVSASPQNQAGSNYNFVLWSDGGSATHTIRVPLTNITLTASFVEPVIGAAPGGAGLNLTWSEWAKPLALFSATNLTPPATWTAVPNAPMITNSALLVVVPMTNGAQFFRLQSP